MGFQCGIVGLPNVGKSTLFNALTSETIEAANYPFCTIEPNKGIVPVPDSRLERLGAVYSPQAVIPAAMTFVDIAGLVSGAAQGEGLGNQFLAHIRETQAIIQVVRCFEDDEITHVSGEVSPKDDMEIIHTELVLADLDTVERAMSKVKRRAGAGDKDARRELALLEQLADGLGAGRAAREINLVEHERQLAAPYCLLTAKPMLIVANCADGDTDDNRLLQEARDAAGESEVIPLCNALEAEIAQLDADERDEFAKEMGIDERGLAKVIRAGYSLLGLHSFFTAGPKEVRAWTIPVGTCAREAAGTIHTDFERGFIRAEVVSLSDLLAAGGEREARELGKIRLEGKDYVVQDGDVMHFRFNV